MQLTEDQRTELKTNVVPLIDDLYRVASQLCHDHCTAEDLVAETVAKACERFGTLRERNKLKPWLMRILTNTFISKWRAKKSYEEVEYSEDGDDEDGRPASIHEVSEPMLLWQHNPEYEFMRKILDEDIRAAIDSLHDDFKIVVVLRDIEGYAYDEIAEILKIPIGTVRSRLARSRGALQKKLWQHAVEIGIVHTKEIHDEQCTCNKRD